jgi:hypothetical protein
MSAQELILQEKRINRQKITTIAIIPVPGMPGVMHPAPCAPGLGGPGLPGPGGIVPAPGTVLPPGTVIPAPEQIKPGKEEPKPGKEEPKPGAVVPPGAVQGAVVPLLPAITQCVLDTTAWLGCNSFIDCQGRCWRQVGGQPYMDQPLRIGGAMLRANDGSMQFFTGSGRLFQLGVDPAVTAQAGAGGPVGRPQPGGPVGRPQPGMQPLTCANGRCGVAQTAVGGQCAGGRCGIR